MEDQTGWRLHMSDSEMMEAGASEEQLVFEKARFEYCATIYGDGLHRKERLEKKTEFYLSFITLFLGAILLNTDLLSQLRDLLANVTAASSLTVLTYSSITALAIALLCSLLSILQATRVRSYTSPYPTKTAYHLFAPKSEYLDRKDSSSLFKASALSYAIAAEDNKKVNDKKAAWMRVAAFGVFIAVLSLMAFLVAVSCLSLL
jgi:hypothetical protein